MPTLESNAQNAGSDAVVDLLDAGAGAGYVEIGDSGFSSVLATIALNDPAYGAAAAGLAALDVGTAVEDSSADATGTAAEWRAYDSNDVEVFRGVVDTSASTNDITLSVGARNAALDAIAALADGGDIQFATDGTFTSVLLTLSLNATAFTSASGGSAALDTSGLNGTADAGTAANYRIRTSGGATIMSGTVDTSGADINFDNNVWAQDQPVVLSDYTLSLPASDSGAVGTMVINSTSIVAGQNVEITSGSFQFPAVAA